MNATPVTPAESSHTAPKAAAETDEKNVTLLLTYDGSGDKLFLLDLKVAILTVLTLGIYRFWGKTEIRRTLWSSITMMGSRLEYSGIGKELFLGFLIALVVIIPLGAMMAAVEFYGMFKGVGTAIIYQYALYAVLLYLFGFAYYRARRYRLSRTLWRSIRFAQTGAAWRYAWVQLGYYVLAILSLGILWPLAQVRLQAYLINNTHFGSRRFQFDGKLSEMMGYWIIAYLLAPFTLGLTLVGYKAFTLRYFASRTKFEGLKFEMPVRFGDLVQIYVPYYF